MRFLRCKCGNATLYTSMGFAECDGCDVCNTTFASHPDGHRQKAPHEWEPDWKINRVTGERKYRERCRNCHKSRDTKEPKSGETE